MSVRRIDGNGSSSWQSPRENESHGSQWMHDRDNLTLTGQAKEWATPQAHDTNKRGVGNRHNPAGGAACLATDAENWATPSSHERTQTPRQVDHGIQLANQTAAWATPTSRDHKDGNCDLTKVPVNSLLGRQVLAATGQESQKGSSQRWATPDQRSYHAQGSFHNPKAQSSQLAVMVQKGNPKKRLNPLFVEWLMGWPIGWTAFEPVATESFLSWRLTHSELLRRL